MKEKEFHERMQRVEALVHKIEALADGEARSSALELLQLIMELHGAGLERILEITYEAKEPGGALIDQFGRDELTGSLLLLYGLHPLDLEMRVEQALGKVAAEMQAHGGGVQLLGIADGVVRVRLERSAGGCGSTAQNLRVKLEEALYNVAPDMLGLEVQEVEQLFPKGLVQLTKAVNGASPSVATGNWEKVASQTPTDTLA